MLNETVLFLKERNELRVAAELLMTFGKYARSVEEYDSIARGYCDIKRYKDSIKWAEKALSMAAGNEMLYAIRANLAKVCNHANMPDKALFYLKFNESMTPEDPELLLEKAFSLFLMNRQKESEAILRALNTRPGLNEQLATRVKFNLGTYDLYKDKFQEGLKGFLIEGKKLNIWNNVKLPLEFWKGGVQPGRTIVIVAEGGIGDEFINVRFCDKLVDYGMIPLWYTTRKDLSGIFNRHGYTTINSLENVPKGSLWTYSMSLPIFLDLKPEDLWNGPYLFPSVDYKNKWDWMNESSETKVGIRWSGNPHYEHDLHRSVPLKDMYTTIQSTGKGFHIYSLQKGDGAEEVEECGGVVDLSRHLESFEDTLAVIDNLDIVVSSCTSVLHAAAAMGKRTYGLIPCTAYYTWCSSNEYKSYWYGDNLTLLRQHELRSWEGPLKELTRCLKETPRHELPY